MVDTLGLSYLLMRVLHVMLASHTGASEFMIIDIEHNVV